MIIKHSKLYQLISIRVLACFILLLNVTASHAGLVTGYIYSRTPVLSEHGHRIWVKYHPETGEYVEKIGDATGNLDPAVWRVMSALEYRSIQEHFNQMKASEPELELLSRSAYEDLTLYAADGSSLFEKEVLSPDTAYIAILPQSKRFLAGVNYILGEYPIDPTVDLANTTLSMLVKYGGENVGQVKEHTPMRIGFKTAFLMDEKGQFISDILGTDLSGKKPIGPISDVLVEAMGFGKGVSGSDGRYVAYWQSTPCPLVGYSRDGYVVARFRYRRFNSQAGQMVGGEDGVYFKMRQITETCTPELIDMPLVSRFIGPIPGGLGTWDTVPKRLDFPIDLSYLSGTAKLSSDGQTTLPLGPVTQFTADLPMENPVWANFYDYDNDGIADTAKPGYWFTDPSTQVTAFRLGWDTVTEDKKLVGIWLSSQTGTGELPTNPHFTRLPDSSRFADYSHQGLLQQISAEDLRNTDLYIVRVSDGTLITEKIGLSEDAIRSDGQFYYSIQMRNRFGDDFNPGEDRDFTQWQLSQGVNPSLHQRQADHLQPGDRIRVYAINRTSGYLGFTETTMQAAGSNGDLSFHIDDIIMRPPNLKVWAERKYNIQHGLSAGEFSREQIIGFEGASLTSDAYIKITTEWLDHQGDPLPMALEDVGYTGQLGILKDSNTLSDASQGLYQFSIQPGKSIQVLALPQERRGARHYYIHVSGEPESGQPVFSGSEHKRYREADFSSTGQNPGILSQRPDNYVPVLTPIFDEANTELQRQAYRLIKANNPDLEKPEPIYRWVYRPEYQFTSYDLDVRELELAQYDEQEMPANAITIRPGDGLPDISSIDVFRLMYDIVTDNYEPLDLFNAGEEKELVFKFGEQEVKATIGLNQEVQFDNRSHISLLTADDFLTIQLYANNDVANALWEWSHGPNFEVILHSLAQGVGPDKRRVDSDIEDTFFFSALGNKKVFVRNSSAVSYPGRIAITEVEDGAFETVPAVGEFVDLADVNKFLFKGGQSVTLDAGDPYRAYKVTFRILFDDIDPITKTLDITIKTNSNTSLQELLDGKAIWCKAVLNAQATGEQKAVHQGQTYGGTPDRQFVDYGQYLMNMVAIPLIKEVKESNLRYAIIPDGDFGAQSRLMLQSFMDADAADDIPSDNTADFADEEYAQAAVISHFDTDTGEVTASTTYRSLRKLLQDYQAVGDETIDNVELERHRETVPSLNFDDYRYAVTTPEAMRGLNYNSQKGLTIAAGGQFTADDLGLYEMYLSYDWDGDGLSNLAEVENSLNGGYQSNLFNPLDAANNVNTDYDDRLLTAYNRGGWGILLNRTNNIFTPRGSGLAMGEISDLDGREIAGLRIPTFAPGLYDLGGADENVDSYTTLPMVQLLEAMGRAWSIRFPDTAPLETDPAAHSKTIATRSGQRRIGINDISARAGGFNRAGHLDILRQGRTTPQTRLSHSTHHNGLDIDMRFVANTEVEGAIDLRTDDGQNAFNVGATIDLLKTIAKAAANKNLTPRALYAGEDEDQIEDGNLNDLCDAIGLSSNCDYSSGHHNHIHISFSNGRSQGVQASANSVEDIEIVYQEGGQNSYIYSEVFTDYYNNALLPWHRIRFTDSVRNAADEEVIQVRSLHPTATQQTKLWVNDQNEANYIGQVRLTITCMRSDDATYPIQLQNALDGNALIKTLNVTCRDSGGDQ